VLGVRLKKRIIHGTMAEEEAIDMQSERLGKARDFLTSSA
jgi:hypothetical protein